MDIGDKLNNFDISALDELNLNPKDLSINDIDSLMDHGQKGIDMVKNIHSQIEGLDNPKIQDGLKKLNAFTKDNEVLNKLKELDLNEVKSKVEGLKDTAETMFKLF